MVTAPISFMTLDWLSSSYVNSYPKEPHPELGLVYSLGSHGSYFFVSAEESTSLVLLRVLFLLAIALFVLIVPKGLVLRRPDASAVDPKFSASIKWDIQPSAELWFILGSSAVGWTILISFAGPRIVNYLVNHGMALQY